MNELAEYQDIMNRFRKAFVAADRELLVGLLGDETTTHVRVKLPLGQERLLPRTQVKGMRSLGQSIMPAGLEAGLTKQQIADLLEFITGQ